MRFYTKQHQFYRGIDLYARSMYVCIFTWYWIADLCSQIGVKFVLGHALYMKAIHGGKVKNDKIDSQKIKRRCLFQSGPHTRRREHGSVVDYDHRKTS